MSEFQTLKEKAGEFSITLNNNQIDQFKEYLRLLDEFNSHTNLVSSTDSQTVIRKHFLDSLSLGLTAEKIELNRKLSIIDIGTGGGFPGIPLLIAFPDWKLCAVDSITKKLEFIKLMSEKIGISNRVEVVAARAEELARKADKRECFDLAVTRAVAKMNVISEYNIPFIKKGGYFIAYKAKSAPEELQEAHNAIFTLGGEYCSTIKYTLSGEEERNLILIKKVAATPENYPRKTGRPTKKPLI